MYEHSEIKTRLNNEVRQSVEIVKDCPLSTLFNIYLNGITSEWNRDNVKGYKTLLFQMIR
jgi:hypothetical protein